MPAVLTSPQSTLFTERDVCHVHNAAQRWHARSTHSSVPAKVGRTKIGFIARTAPNGCSGAIAVNRFVRHRVALIAIPYCTEQRNCSAIAVRAGSKKPTGAQSEAGFAYLARAACTSCENHLLPLQGVLLNIGNLARSCTVPSVKESRFIHAAIFSVPHAATHADGEITENT